MSFEVLLHKLRVAKTRLRVLLVGTDPYDKLPVGTEIDKVREALRTACAKASMADPEIVEIPSHRASCERLGQMLAAPAFHIFHFAGHGFPDHLLLNDKGQPEERVPCDDEHKPHPQLSCPDWTTLPGTAFSRG
jgi:hypothetical protein